MLRHLHPPIKSVVDISETSGTEANAQMGIGDPQQPRSLGPITRITFREPTLNRTSLIVVVYEHCVQYNVNFTKIFEENNHQWPSEPDPDWPKKPCSEGWDYDHSEYKDTLVTEVRFI